MAPRQLSFIAHAAVLTTHLGCRPPDFAVPLWLGCHSDQSPFHSGAQGEVAELDVRVPTSWPCHHSHFPLHSPLRSVLSLLRALAWAPDTARKGFPLGSVSSRPFHKPILDCPNWEYFSPSLKFYLALYLSRKEPPPFALRFSYMYPCPNLSQAAPSSKAASRQISPCVLQGTLPRTLC